MTRYFDKYPMTLQDLIDRGFALDKPIALSDPDTYWILRPIFIEYEDEILVTSDYDRVVRK